MEKTRVKRTGPKIGRIEKGRFLYRAQRLMHKGLARVSTSCLCMRENSQPIKSCLGKMDSFVDLAVFSHLSRCSFALVSVLSP